MARLSKCHEPHAPAEDAPRAAAAIAYSALLSVNVPGSGDELRVMTIVDDGARNYHVQPSPDGRHIVFRVYRHGVWLMDVADGSMRCILTGPTAEEFAWAPDGRRLAFHSRRDGQWGIWIMASND